MTKFVESTAKSLLMNREQVYIQDWRLHSGFLESAARYPNAPALYVNEREWTYAEVEDEARRWASSLLEALSRQPQRIGVFAYRNKVSYIGVLASLFAGATFIPLNRNFPLQRTRFMVSLADIDAIFVDEESLPQIASILEGLPRMPYLLLPDSEASKVPNIGAKILDKYDLQRDRPLENLPKVDANAHAYLLFTSGSTGQIKGVPISHANVVHFLKVNQQRYQITPNDRLTQTFNQTFDLSIFDLFMAWDNGACTYSLQPIQLLSPFRFVREKDITVWFSVPSVAALLRKKNLLNPGSLPSLRWSLFCGEALPRATAEAWQAAAPNSIVENLYGPTELTIACAAYRWNPTISPSECVNDVVPIGQVYEGLHHIVVDEKLQPVPPGEVGELCVAGPQTFSGYWRDSEKTAACIFKLPLSGKEELRYYRTGDRVRLFDESNYFYLSRTDYQVKVLGHRVELGEIEAALRREPGVVDAAVLAWAIEEGNARALVAFVTGFDIDVQALAVALRTDLPDYMIPRNIYNLDVMPLNTNGKIDRKALHHRLETSSLGVTVQ